MKRTNPSLSEQDVLDAVLHHFSDLTGFVDADTILDAEWDDAQGIWAVVGIPEVHYAQS